ncbi:MAG: serine/threonine-protein kinase [Myxococcota bacterium]
MGEDPRERQALERTERLSEKRLIAGKYELGRLLGEGGMGAVYEGFHRGLGSFVAVKILGAHISSNPTSVERFRREAQAAARVRHDNVVQVYDTGTDDEGVPFIVMEYLDGESLSAILTRERRLSSETACTVAAQILSGLAAAHEQGVVHRDLKPPNIFICHTSDGIDRVKILDFGISKIGGSSVQLTADGGMVGTPHYMAPEQVRAAKDVDHRADIYAVGVLLYRMVTGSQPYASRGGRELYDQILAGVTTPPSLRVSNLNAELEAVILRALEADRGRRFQDARSMRTALFDAMPSLPRPSSVFPSGTGDLFRSHARTLGAAADHVDSRQDRTVPHRPSALQAPWELKEDGAYSDAPLPGTPIGAPRSVEATQGLKSAVALAVVVLASALGVWLLYRGATVSPARVTGELQNEDSIAVSGPPLRFGLSRYIPERQVRQRHASVARYLERTLRRPVVMAVVPDYQDLAQKVTEGEIDLAALSPYIYVQARQEAPTLRLLATPVMRDNVSSYEGYIVTRSNSDIRRLEDLRGKVFCYVSPTSTSGYLYPRALLRRVGLHPDRDFAGTRLTGDHISSLRALSEGACDAAAAYADAVFSAPSHGMHRETFHILASTDRIPLDAYVSPPAVEPELANALRGALLALVPGSELALEVLGQKHRLRGFVEADDADYDSVREIERYLVEEREDVAGDWTPPKVSSDVER